MSLWQACNIIYSLRRSRELLRLEEIRRSRSQERHRLHLD